MITVLAGVNGAGKSSVAGSFIRSRGGTYFNPDEHARRLVESGQNLHEANAAAWLEGYELLKTAIATNRPFTFETTLGGRSITQELLVALGNNIPVRVFYCGLDSPDLHIQRVATRVANGGHDIPREKIRQRWGSSRRNCAELVKAGADITIYDNSLTRPDGTPAPKLLLSMAGGKITNLADPMPFWAKLIAVEALARSNSA